MYHSPNERYIKKETADFNPYDTGKEYSSFNTGFNQIAKQFKPEIAKIKKDLKKEEDELKKELKDTQLKNEAYDILLSKGYYEGSKYGRFYKGGDTNRTSKIYVNQPEIEKRLDDKFIGPKEDMVKFLVGYTGVGKTTLLRNIFRIYDRDAVEFNNNLIIYISFFAMGDEKPDNKRTDYENKQTDYDNEWNIFNNKQEKSEKIRKAVLDVLVGAIENAITLAGGFSDYSDRISTYDDTFYEELYDFIKTNNPTLISGEGSSPKNVRIIREKIKEFGSKKIGTLQYLAEKSPIDYAMSQLKYFLLKAEKAYKNVIVIIDDIENQSDNDQTEIIKQAYHMQKCMQANGNEQSYRTYSFKVLVSLRNYVFRNNKIKEVYREFDLDDIIVKDKTPSLTEILKRRFEIYSSTEKDSRINNAYEELMLVLGVMDKQYDSILLNITHYNIFACLKILLRVLTNKQFIGQNEVYKNGAFVVDNKAYNINSKTVFYAMAYGEKKYYVDIGNYYLTNILHYRNSEHANNELLGLYIIKYLIKNDYYLKVLCFRSEMNIRCNDVVDRISNCFNNTSFEQEYTFKNALNASMKHLYEGGVVLESLYNPTYHSSGSIDRVYQEDMEIYLSLRGKQLYDLLSIDSLLLEIYRDDIETELEGNTTLTNNMTAFKRFVYCFKYVEYLFDVEKRLLEKVSNWNVYIGCFGKTLAVVTLLAGLKTGIDVYYLEKNEDSRVIRGMYDDLCRSINDYIRNINITQKIQLNYVEEE